LGFAAYAISRNGKNPKTVRNYKLLSSFHSSHYFRLVDELHISPVFLHLIAVGRKTQVHFENQKAFPEQQTISTDSSLLHFCEKTTV